MVRMRRYKKTDCNHVFMNAAPVMRIDPTWYAKKLQVCAEARPLILSK